MQYRITYSFDSIRNLSYIADNISAYDQSCKKFNNTSQDFEAKMKTSEEHAEGKPSSEKLNKAKVKARDGLT
jgi:hypothetical protein